MLNYLPTKQHLRNILLYWLKFKINASKAHRLLFQAYPKYASVIKVYQTWFNLFKSGDFKVEDRERLGQVKKFKDEELEALLDSVPFQTQQELAESLNIDQATISRCLKVMRMIQKKIGFRTN